MIKSRAGSVLALVLAGGLGGAALLAPLKGAMGWTSVALAASPSPAPDTPSSQPSGGGMNGLDFAGLSSQQIKTIVQILTDNRCNCSCGMTLAECREKDPKCSRSLSLARQVVEDVRAGKDRATAQGNLAAALAKTPAPPPAAPAPAEDPNKVYKIDTTGAPYKGPKSASVTIVEFSDYQ